MNHMKKLELWGGLSLIALTAIIYIGSIGIVPSLFDDVDSFYAEVAREMCTRHDWITPYANSIRFLEKPPLFYWLISFFYSISGAATAFTARLPTALTVMALVFVTFKIGKMMFGQRAGLFGGLALATSVGLFLFTRVILPDALFTLFLSLLIYSFLRWERSDRKTAPLLWMYAFCGLAVLTKGLIGIVFPICILFFTFLATGRLKDMLRLLSIKGFLIFLAITLPWHVLMIMRNQGFFWFYFINEHVLRFLGNRYPMDYGTVPLAPFWLLHMIWLFPWSFYLITLCWPGHFRRAMSENGRDMTLLLAWTFTILIFFSFSTRLEYYTLPALPALAILAGAQCNNCWERRLIRPGLVLASISLLVGMALVIIAIFFSTGGADGMFNAKNIHDFYFYYFGPLFDLTPEAMHALLKPLLLAGLSLGLILPLHLLMKKAEMKAVFLTGGMIIFFFAANLGFMSFAPRITSKPIADEILRHLNENPNIIIDGKYEEMSSVAFYTRQPVFVYDGQTYNLEYGSHYPDAPPLFLNDAGLRQLWNQSRRLFLVTTQSRQTRLERVIPQDRYIVAEYGNKVLFSNKPIDMMLVQKGDANPDVNNRRVLSGDRVLSMGKKPLL